MRREDAENNWRQKFKSLNLDECFEFLYRNWNTHKGGKCGIRCKKCGAEFETYALEECIKGNQTYISCSKCGTSSNGKRKLVYDSSYADEIAEFYTEGHSVWETAERFGLTKAQVNNFVRRKCLTNGRKWHEGTQEANDQRAKEAENRLIKRLNANSFDYLGGYETGHITVKCRTCGDTFERSYDALRKRIPICFECQKVETEKRQAKIKQQHILKSEERKKEREEEKQRVEAEKAEALFHLLNDKTHICSACGKSFSIADYMKDCDLKQIQHNPKYCSDACKRRATHRRGKEREKLSGNFDGGNHRHRARKYGVAYESGITLKKLWKRDGGICQICGKPCDWNDRSWNKYCGPTYPSDDHIIPMVKGGPHTWDNVQLAHMMCNSEKGDTID